MMLQWSILEISSSSRKKCTFIETIIFPSLKLRAHHEETAIAIAQLMRQLGSYSIHWLNFEIISRSIINTQFSKICTVYLFCNIVVPLDYFAMMIISTSFELTICAFYEPLENFKVLPMDTNSFLRLEGAHGSILSQLLENCLHEKLPHEMSYMHRSFIFILHGGEAFISLIGSLLTTEVNAGHVRTMYYQIIRMSTNNVYENLTA